MGNEFMSFDKGGSSEPLTSQSFCKARALKEIPHLFKPLIFLEYMLAYCCCCCLTKMCQ